MQQTSTTATYQIRQMVAATSLNTDTSRTASVRDNKVSASNAAAVMRLDYNECEVAGLQGVRRELESSRVNRKREVR